MLLDTIGNNKMKIFTIPNEACPFCKLPFQEGDDVSPQVRRDMQIVFIHDLCWSKSCHKGENK